MASKTTDEKLKELEQKINRLRMEKKKLQTKKTDEERKKRNHAMILVGTTIMTHFPDKMDEIINADDETIVNWVHSLFKKREPDTARYAAEQTWRREDGA